RAAAAEATARTHHWAQRCLRAHSGTGSLFPICQGGMHPDLRRDSAAFVADLGADGNAIGGLGLGESKQITWQMLEASIERLPGNRPRYVMGIGAPEDLLNGVARGADMFDCVLPTRLGRNGAVFTHDGKLNLRNASLARRDGPIERGCDCECCAEFSLAYLHHLFHCEELLGYRLASIHNLRFLVRLMEQARAAILRGGFSAFHDEFNSRYRPPDEGVRSEQRKRWRAARARWSRAAGILPASAHPEIVDG
ncbi:MAG TPA: tRNA guanosine(34) transglycosylase Tgt, partial [Dehalococcoidia bacterium]|nr:tRNA guanosine(34) transglycosylase Tgt [Dehalococcoidia bacterium]